MPSDSKKKSATEAARLAEARARKAQKQYGGEPEHQAKVIFTDEEWRDALDNDDFGLSRLAIRTLKNFIFDTHRQTTLEYQPDIGAYLPDDSGQAKVAMREALEPYIREKINFYNEILRDPATEKDAKPGLQANQKRYKHVLKTLSSKRGLENIFDLARTGKDSIAKPTEIFDPDHEAIHARGRKICLKTGQDRPSTPNDFATKYCNAEWRGLRAECPEFISFLESSLDGNKAKIEYLQRAIGVAATAFPAREVHFLYGKHGWNGKSVLAEVLSELLTEYAYALPSQVLMDNPRGGGAGPAPEVAEIQGRRLIISSETKRGGLFNIPMIKQLTGGDRITARGLYSKLTSFKPLHSLWLLTNHLPRIGNDESAFWERCRIIEFTFQYVDNPDPQKPFQRQRDPDLKNKLLSENEKSGILAWIVRGAMQWHQDGRILKAPREVLEPVKAYRLAEDSVEAFVDSCCAIDNEASTTAKILYDHFLEWHTDQFGENAKPFGRKKFGEGLASRFQKIDPRTDPSVRYPTYIGVRLK